MSEKKYTNIVPLIGNIVIVAILVIIGCGLLYSFYDTYTKASTVLASSASEQQK